MGSNTKIAFNQLKKMEQRDYYQHLLLFKAGRTIFIWGAIEKRLTYNYSKQLKGFHKDFYHTINTCMNNKWSGDF